MIKVFSFSCVPPAFRISAKDFNYQFSMHSNQNKIGKICICFRLIKKRTIHIYEIHDLINNKTWTIPSSYGIYLIKIGREGTLQYFLKNSAKSLLIRKRQRVYGVKIVIFLCYILRNVTTLTTKKRGLTYWRIQGAGFRGLEPPFFWTINAFEWEHIVGTLPLFTLGWEPPFLKWLDPPLKPH